MFVQKLSKSINLFHECRQTIGEDNRSKELAPGTGRKSYEDGSRGDISDYARPPTEYGSLPDVQMVSDSNLPCHGD
jgi:hypothetical protein